MKHRSSLDRTHCSAARLCATRSGAMQRPFGPLRIWKFLKRNPAAALIQKKAEKAMCRRLSAGCRVEMKAEKKEKMVAAIANAMKAMKAMKAMQ